MADRQIVFYFRQKRKDGTGRYVIGGSAMRVDVEPVYDPGTLEIGGWRAVTWLPHPDGSDRRHRQEVQPSRHTTIPDALRAYAIDRGYDVALIEGRAGIRTQIHPSPGHASGVPP